MTSKRIGLPPSIFELIRSKLGVPEEAQGIDMDKVVIVAEDTERSDATQEILSYINDTPEIISMLYDMDLLPEQLVEGSFQWGLMVGIAQAYRDRVGSIQAEECLATAIKTIEMCAAFIENGDQENFFEVRQAWRGAYRLAGEYREGKP